MERVHALICGVDQDSQGHHLPGAEADVLGWSQRLQAMGVHPNHIVQLSTASSAPPTRARVLEAVETLARRLAVDPLAQGLLVVSAHGGDGALFHAVDGPIKTADLVAVLDSVAPDSSITAILDICTDQPITSAMPGLRPQDLVLRAAGGGHPAEEHRAGDRWQGAFSWACHQVLDRWMAVGPHGALVPISARVLVDQASLLLRGLGYGQRPTLQGPTRRFDAPMLGGDHVLAAPLRPGLTRQQDPGGYDTFKVYDLRDAAGSSIGSVIVTAADWTPTGNWKAGSEYWTTAIPTADFSLEPTSAGLPSTVPQLRYEHVAFNPSGSTTSYSLPSGSFKISSGGSVTGYLKPGPSQLEWYKTATVTKFYPLATLVFNKLSTSTSITAQQRLATKY